MNKKELVQKLFKGRAVPRPPFIPLVGAYLTKVNQVPVEEIYNDSNTLASSIVNTQQLLGYDALTLPVDPVLEAEALGVKVNWRDQELPAVREHFSVSQDLDLDGFITRGRIPQFIESARRLVMVNGQEYPIVATVTGPLTIMKNLYGEDVFSENPEMVKGKAEKVSQALIQLCKSYGDEKVDGIIIYEDVYLKENQLNDLCTFYKPIFNVIKFYNIFGVLRLSPEMNANQSLSNLPDCVLGSREFVLKSSKIKTKGVALEDPFWSDPFDHQELASVWNSNNKRRLFISTSQPLGLHLNLPELQDRVTVLCDDTIWA